MSTWTIPDDAVLKCDACQAETFAAQGPGTGKGAKAKPGPIRWLDVVPDNAGLITVARRPDSRPRVITQPEGKPVYFDGGPVPKAIAQGMVTQGGQMYTEHKATCRKRGGSRKKDW